MPTRYEEQVERYLKTPCPAKASRKKLRSVMWQNRDKLTSKALLSDIGRKQGQAHSYRLPPSQTNNVSLFKEMISSFGGFFQEFDHTGERKKHTSGRRESRPRFIEKEN